MGLDVYFRRDIGNVLRLCSFLARADLSAAVGLTVQQLELCEIDDDTRLPTRLG